LNLRTDFNSPHSFKTNFAHSKDPLFPPGLYLANVTQYHRSLLYNVNYDTIQIILLT